MSTVLNTKYEQRVEELRAKHRNYIKSLRDEMQKCLEKSEKARDGYNKAVEHFKDKGAVGYNLDEYLKTDRVAQAHVSNSQLYDRWTTKYASVIAAEVAMYNADIH